MLKNLLISIILLLNLVSLGQLTKGSADSYHTKNTGLTLGATEVSVFPNPVTDKKFTLESRNFPIAELNLLNIAGKVVYSRNLNNPVQKYQINLENFQNGIYILKVKLTDDQIRTVKVMIRNQ